MSLTIRNTNIIDGKIEGLEGISRENVDVFIREINWKIKPKNCSEAYWKYAKKLHDKFIAGELEMIVGKVQSGKTMIAMLITILSLNKGNTVICLSDNSENLVEQTKKRFQELLSEVNFGDKLKNETEKIKKGDCVVVMGNQSRIQQIMDNLVNPKTQDLHLILDEADVQYKTKGTKFTKLKNQMIQKFRSVKFLDITATGAGLMIDRLAIKDSFMEKVEYLESQHNYIGYEDCDRIVYECSDFVQIKDIIEIHKFTKEGQKYNIKMLVKTEWLSNKQSELQKKVYEYMKENWLGDVSFNIFKVNSEKNSKITCFSNEETKIYKTLDEVKNAITKHTLSNINSIDILIGDGCIDRGITLRGDVSDKNVWQITHQLLRKSKTTDAESIYQGCRLLGNFGDSIKPKLYMDNETFKKLDTYMNDIYSQLYDKKLGNEIDNTKYEREISPENNSLSFFTNEKKNFKLGNGLNGKKVKTINTPNSNYVMDVDIDFDEKMMRLVDSWLNVNNSTDIAKLFRKMVENGGKLESDLVKETLGDGPTSAMTLPNHPRNWSFVFKKENGFHYLREEVFEYIE